MCPPGTTDLNCWVWPLSSFISAVNVQRRSFLRESRLFGANGIRRSSCFDNVSSWDYRSELLGLAAVQLHFSGERPTTELLTGVAALRRERHTEIFLLRQCVLLGLQI